MEEFDITQLTQEKIFKIELKTNKNNSYLITFNLSHSIEIEANQINGLIKKTFSEQFTYQKIRENRYFRQFDALNEIFDELNRIFKKNKILIEEDENNIKLNIPLPSITNKEIIFELKERSKNDKDKLNDLIQLITKQKEEISNLKEELASLKKSDNELKNEITIIKKEDELKNELNLLKKEIVNFKNENEQLKMKDIQIQNENKQLKEQINQVKKEFHDLKEKINLVFINKEDNNLINNLNSKILKGNEEYNRRLKYWIAPSRKIRAELLYRLTDNGDRFETFHQLCDNKGPTLTLFYINDRKIVGIYTPLSWDTDSSYCSDMDTFIFNLIKNRKYKKLSSNRSIYCNRDSGPSTLYFGCNHFESMRKIKHVFTDDHNTYFENGKEVLPNSKNNNSYNLLE